MKSNSDVRIYRMIDVADASLVCELRTLPVKEKEVVISNIEFGGLQERFDDKAAEDGTTFPCKIGEQINEQVLVDYVTELGDTLLIDVTNEETMYDPEGSGGEGGA